MKNEEEARRAHPRPAPGCGSVSRSAPLVKGRLQRVPTSAEWQPPAVFLLCSLVLICGHKFPVIPRTAAARPQRAGHTQRFCGGQGPEFLVLTARMDHNLLWSFRLGFISKVFFGRTWSDLVGLTWIPHGLPRRSLTKAGRAELPLRRLFTSNTPALMKSGLGAWSWEFFSP